MSKEVTVEGGLTRESAVLLLAACEELGVERSVVRTTTRGFVAPKDVVKKAGLKGFDPDADLNAELKAARKAVEADDGSHDHAAPAPEKAPVIDPDTGKLVEDPEVTKVATEVQEPAKPVEVSANPEPPRVGRGSGTEAWKAYAKGKGASDADIADLGRDALVEKYGTKE